MSIPRARAIAPAGRHLVFVAALFLLAVSACSRGPAPRTADGADNAGDLALIPGGTFLMGALVELDHQPVHPVTVGSFYLETTEVTNAQYATFCEATGHHFPQFWNVDAFHCGERWPDHPVVFISQVDAAKYAEWRGMRLPTEAEWEWAARGGLRGKKWPHGDELTPEDANYWREDGPRGTVPVASFAANGYGLFDMAGNVGEWCADRYDVNGYQREPAVDPTGPEEGKYVVVRGGGWHSGPYCTRVYRRLGLLSYFLDFNLGFRCAKDAD